MVFSELADAVADGTELAEAMSTRPDVFTRVHVAMVRAGEKGGFLEQVLSRLGSFLLAQADLRARVIGSMIYPSVLVVVGTLILGAIFAGDADVPNTGGAPAPSLARVSSSQSSAGRRWRRPAAIRR